MNKGKRTIWLIDSDKYLARLLNLKLAQENVVIGRLNPADLELLQKQTDTEKGTAVIVSLPQPGISSRDLITKTRNTFPGLPIIDLVPALAGSENDENNSFGATHSFRKPLQVDSFFSLLASLLNKSPKSSESLDPSASSGPISSRFI